MNTAQSTAHEDAMRLQRGWKATASRDECSERILSTLVLSDDVAAGVSRRTIRCETLRVFTTVRRDSSAGHNEAALMH